MAPRDPLPEGLRPGGRFDTWRRAPARYVVADVDGTLIGPFRHATDRVVEAAQALSAAGVAVGFATGREWDGVADLQVQLGLAGPHVLHNGGEVRTAEDVLMRWTLLPGQVLRLLEICQDHDLYAEFYVGEGFVVTDCRSQAEAHWRLLGKKPDGVLRSTADLEAMAPGPQVLRTTIVLADGRDPDLGFVMGQLSDLGASASAGWSPMTPGLTYINVTHPEADKGKALAVAATHVGVPLSAVGAVGDGLNDVPLLEVAGTAIAMGQAPAEVQAAAHLVVPEVAADGVAHALAALAVWAGATEPGDADRRRLRREASRQPPS